MINGLAGCQEGPRRVACENLCMALSNLIMF